MNLLLFALIFLLPFFSLADEVSETTLTEVGEKAPDVKIITLEGGEFKLSELRGKLVLLNFFATWCGPCMAEMPHLELDVWQKFKNADFLLIAVGREHTKADLDKFLKTVNFTFPLAPDPQREIYSKFATQYIPRNVLIDQTGTIIYQSVGYAETDFQKMIDLIEKTLSKARAEI